jgi:hypothetical protein
MTLVPEGDDVMEVYEFSSFQALCQKIVARRGDFGG